MGTAATQREGVLMRNLVVPFSLTAMSIIFTSGLASSAVAQQPPIDVKGVTRKLIAEEVLSGYLTDLNGKYKMTVAEFTIAPGGYFGPHHHAGPGFRCVLSGEVTNEEPEKTTIYKADQCYWE